MSSMETFQTYPDQFSPDQYRARAQLARCTADEMTRETMRRQLLRLAEEYERLAESVEQARFSAG
jgi:hypothetical protein